MYVYVHIHCVGLCLYIQFVLCLRVWVVVVFCSILLSDGLGRSCIVLVATAMASCKIFWVYPPLLCVCGSFFPLNVWDRSREGVVVVGTTITGYIRVGTGVLLLFFFFLINFCLFFAILLTVLLQFIIYVISDYYRQLPDLFYFASTTACFLQYIIKSPLSEQPWLRAWTPLAERERTRRPATKSMIKIYNEKL